MLNRPKTEEYPPYYAAYISKVPEGDILDILFAQQKAFTAFITTLTEERLSHRYEVKKWSIREVLVHINDVERIFTYRLLSFSRKESNDLPGFDHNAYVENNDFSHLSMEQIKSEFVTIREATLRLIKNLSEEQHSMTGVANGNEINVRSICYILAGHLFHHLEIIKTRYLS